MGLGALYGASGIDKGIRRRIFERLQAERLQQEMILSQRGADRADRALDQNDQFRRDQQAALQEQRDAVLADRDLTQSRALDESTPAGFLPQGSPIAGRLVKIGAAVPVDERPRIDEGPLLPGDTGAALAAGFEKRPTALQANTQADNERAAAQAQATTADRAEARRLQEQGLEVQRETAAQRSADAAAMRAVAGGNRELTNQMTQLRIDAERAKQEGAERDRVKAESTAKDSATTALDLIGRLETHPGMGAATGAYELRGITQGARDFNAIRNQLAAILTLPNLGSLKGPMSDKDILFVKQLATRLSDTNLSEGETRKALAEAKARFSGGATAPGGGAPGRIRYDLNGNPVK